jgi:hypothetical protein
MKETISGRCHCGGVRFTTKLVSGLSEPRRCNCSICRMRGAVVVTALYDDLVVTAGKELLALYRFGTMKAEHYFCSRCGIYPFHRRRSNLNHMSVNVACLDGVSPFDFKRVPVYDGMTHPNDRPGGYRIVGELTYQSLG